MRTPIREFLQQRRTGKSPIMVLLDKVLENPAALRNHPHLSAFREAGHADTVCPGCREWLGLNDEQVDHINHWPASLKERARRAIIEAIDEGQDIDFFWRVTPLNDELAEVEKQDGHIVVRFASPERVVRLLPDGDVEVGEGNR